MGKSTCHVATILPLPEGQLAQSVGDAHVPFPCGKEAASVTARAGSLLLSPSNTDRKQKSRRRPSGAPSVCAVTTDAQSIFIF